MVAPGAVSWVLKELPGHDSGHDDDERNEELEEGGEDDPQLTLFEAFGGQGPLGDELVQPPIIEIGDPESDDQRRPGDDRDELAGMMTWSLSALAERTPDPAHGLEADDQGDEPAEDEGRTLEEVGPGDGFQSAPGRIQGRR